MKLLDVLGPRVFLSLPLTKLFRCWRLFQYRWFQIQCLTRRTFFIQNSSDLQDIQIHETCSCLRNCWFTWTPRPLMGGRGLDKRRRRKVKILIVINEPVMRWGKGVLPTREFQRERQFDIYKFLSQQKLRLFAKCLLNIPLPASKFASYFGNYNWKLFKIIQSFQNLQKKLKNFEFFLEISKTTEGPQPPY